MTCVIIIMSIAGADLRPHTTVKAVKEKNGRVELVLDNNTTIAADHVGIPNNPYIHVH